MPQATLSHHVQDSTHIANEVLTAALVRRSFRIEASGFHGAEPNENRWNIDYGAIDSWASRLTWTPGDNWTGQVSVGRLTHPEAAEPGDVVRSTASLTYNRPLTNGNWASSLIWGRNHKTAEQHNLNSYLAESVYQFKGMNYVTGRFELVDKDELFNDQPAIREAPGPDGRLDVSHRSLHAGIHAGCEAGALAGYRHRRQLSRSTACPRRSVLTMASIPPVFSFSCERA